MARPRSQTTLTLKAKLIARLTDGFHRPGDRFLSNRALAERHRVSYQTAHRLIDELCREGYLERRAASGTYVSGSQTRLTGVEFWFHPRAREAGSFGAALLASLQRALEDEEIDYIVRWAEGDGVPDPKCYPVLWEVPEILTRLTNARHYALLLNDRPAPGLAASLIDAIATDDFSAGVCAAQVLLAHSPRGKKFAVVSGPVRDQRSCQRVAGFCSVIPRAENIQAGGWYFEHAAKVAARALVAGRQGIFCVNDRLASAVLKHAQRTGAKLPPLVGHDNAPIAEELHLTTIALPWDEFTRTAVEVIKMRLNSGSGAAQHRLLAQRPVWRLTARPRAR